MTTLASKFISALTTLGFSDLNARSVAEIVRGAFATVDMDGHEVMDDVAFIVDYAAAKRSGAAISIHFGMAMPSVMARFARIGEELDARAEATPRLVVAA